MKTKYEYSLKIQPPEIKALLSSNNIPFDAEGYHKNILRFSSVVAFAQAGALLFNSGFSLSSQIKFSRRYGMSKQLVSNWVRRDGKLTEIYFDDGSRVAFVVDRD